MLLWGQRDAAPANLKEEFNMGFTHFDKVAVKGGLFAGTKGAEVPICLGNPVVNCTAATLAIAAKEHANKIITLNRAAGIAATLPEAKGTGHKYTFIVGTTFTANATIKVTGDDVMVGYAILLQDAADTMAGFATAADSDTITMFTAANNTTGGVAGACIELIDIAADTWWVRYVSAAGGAEATPFSATVGS